MESQLAECRVYERRNCQVPTSCAPASANEMRWEGTIEDLSRTGVSLRLRRRFEPRSSLAIELPGKNGQDPYTVYVKVVHVRRDDDGLYTLGCRLVGELADDELERLTTLGGIGAASAAASAAEVHAPDQATPPPPSDAPGRTVIPEVTLSIAAPNGQTVRCRVRQFHVGGAWPLPPGSALNLRGVATDGSQLAHRFEVVQCIHGDAGWQVQVRAADASSAPAWLR